MDPSKSQTDDAAEDQRDFMAGASRSSVWKTWRQDSVLMRLGRQPVTSTKLAQDSEALLNGRPLNISEKLMSGCALQADSPFHSSPHYFPTRKEP